MKPGTDMFFQEISNTKAARDGAVVRRKVKDVEYWVGREVFLREVGRRGFRVFENGGQFVIFCNQEPLKRVI